ncbi:MAG: DUF2268 domain-containing putative Zn-dependent protease [Cyclobacteriaceae bacterium]
MNQIKSLFILTFLLTNFQFSTAQNRDPEKIEIVTSDLDNFWIAFDESGSGFNPDAFKRLYLKKGSKGLKGFMRGRIKNADNLSQVISKRPEYYESLRNITPKIPLMKNEISYHLVKMKEFYPDAIFPPVYFVIGVMNSGGTTSGNGLIIGADMYGLTEETPMEELNSWHRSVLKSVDEIPHIVAHELVHFQQKYDSKNLLGAAIKEGAADFIAELVSGRHINQHVHDFANPKEEELWFEFKDRMFDKDYQGWLYSSQKGRPNDLGYWMGYKIVKAYFDNSPDKKKAIHEIMNIRDFEAFLESSGYAEKFKQ